MAVQSVPSMMGITKAPYASFAGKSEAAAVVTKRRRHFAAIIASGGYGLVMWILGGLNGAV